MATNKTPSPYSRITALNENEDGTFTAVYKWVQYRFLLQGGQTIDIHAIQDGSDLREWVLHHTKAEAIDGSTTVPPPPVEEPVQAKPKPSKRPAKKTAAA